MKRLALCGIALLALTACSSGPSADSSGPPAITSDKVVRSGSDIQLPLDSYLMTAEQQNTFSRAHDLVGRDCMKRLGFDWQVNKEPVVDEMGNPQAGRYGIIDAQAAAQRGYHPDPAVVAKQQQRGKKPGTAGISPEMALAWSGRGASSLKGKAVPEGGCGGEAVRVLSQGAPAQPSLDIQRLGYELFQKAQADNRVQDAMSRWKQCMAKRGFTYKDIWAVTDDVRWATPAPSAEEISTAKADVACKQESDLVNTWFRVEYAFQQREIERRPEELKQIKERMDAQLRNAAKTLAGNS